MKGRMDSMDDLTWENRLLLWAELWFEWHVARAVVRWYRWRGHRVKAVAWAFKHYGREAGAAVLGFRAPR